MQLAQRIHFYSKWTCIWKARWRIPLHSND